MRGWEKTVAQLRREAHMSGVLDTLHHVLDLFEKETHACQAREWAERLYRDPQELDRFIRDSHAAREK